MRLVDRHNTSKLVVNYLVTNKIDTVVIGKNDNWKQGANIGKKNNQNFTQIPYSKLIQQITNKVSTGWGKSHRNRRKLHQ